MANEQLVELYLEKRDNLEPEERRMIVGLLGFAPPAVRTARAATLPGPAPMAPALPVPNPLTVAAAPVERPREPYKVSAETRRRMSEAAKARVARDGGEQLKKMVETAAKAATARRARGEGRTFSDDTRQKMSESAAARWARGDGGGFPKGHHHTEETLMSTEIRYFIGFVGLTGSIGWMMNGKFFVTEAITRWISMASAIMMRNSMDWRISAATGRGVSPETHHIGTATEPFGETLKLSIIV